MKKHISKILVLGLSVILVACNSGESSSNNSNSSANQLVSSNPTVSDNDLASIHPNSVGSSNSSLGALIIGDSVVGKLIDDKFVTSYVGNNNRAIAYGANKLVAVGSDIYYNSVAVSTSLDDGLTWGEEDVPALAGSLWDIKYANNMFVAVGDDGLILTSTDGKVWNQENSKVNVRLRGITYAENQFMVVGSNGTVLTSSDAKTWTQQASNTTSDLTGISYADHSFVVVGGLDSNDRQATVLRSENGGVTWQKEHSLLVGQLWSITYSATNYEFVAVGNTNVPDQGVLLTSPDGITWTKEVTNDNDLIKVSADARQIIALSSNGDILTSNDGENWSHKQSPTDGCLSAVIQGKNRYSIVGLDGVILNSKDGQNWQEISSHLGSALTVGNGKYVAVGANKDGDGTISTSADGVIWNTQTPKLSGDLTHVIYGNNQFVAVGVNGAILTSPDAKRWTAQNSGAQANFLGVTYGKDKYVITGQDLRNSNAIILTSRDGIEWTQRAYKVTQNKLLKLVIYVNGQYVAIGANLQTNGVAILTSSDGISWEDKSPKILGDLTGVTYGNNQFVAVGINGAILTSEDGSNWHPQLSGVNVDFYNISYSNGEFISVGKYGTILTSSDGMHWKLADSKIHNSLYGVSGTLH